MAVLGKGSWKSSQWYSDERRNNVPRSWANTHLAYITDAEIALLKRQAKGIVERSGPMGIPFFARASDRLPAGSNNAKTASNVPVQWKSSADHPVARLVYVTDAQAKLLKKMDIHGSGVDKHDHYGPDNVPSYQGDGGGGGDGGGDGGGGGGDGGDGGGNGSDGADGGDGSAAAGDAASVGDSGEGPAASAAAAGAMGDAGNASVGDSASGFGGGFGDVGYGGSDGGGGPYNPAGDAAGGGTTNPAFPGISPDYQTQDSANRQLYQSIYQPQYTNYLDPNANAFALSQYNTDMQPKFSAFANPFSLAQSGNYGGIGGYGGAPQAPTSGYGGLGSLGGYGSYGGFGNYGNYGGIGDLFSNMMDGGNMGGAPNYGIAGLYR